MSMKHFSFHKIKSNNLNLGYLNKLTNQIDLCFPKLYFSPSIRAKIECIEKELLVHLNWSNKAIWKSALNRATKDVFVIWKIILKNTDRCTK